MIRIRLRGCSALASAVLGAGMLAGGAAAQRPAPRASAAGPVKVLAYALFSSNHSSLLNFVFRTNRALPVQSEGYDYAVKVPWSYDVQSNGHSWTISSKLHCYELSVFGPTMSAPASHYRVQLGSHGAIFDRVVATQVSRFADGRGQAIGCRSRVADAVIVDYNEEPWVKPSRWFFEADAGPYVKAMRWSGWGNSTVTGSGIYECDSGLGPCSTAAVQRYPVTVRLSGPVRSADFGAYCYKHDTYRLASGPDRGVHTFPTSC